MLDGFHSPLACPTTCWSALPSASPSNRDETAKIRHVWVQVVLGNHSSTLGFLKIKRYSWILLMRKTKG